MAKEGIARKIGESRRESANRIPATMEVRPVRPPSATPEALSTKVVTVEVPQTAPTVVPTASERSAPLIFGKFAVFVEHICLGSYADQSSKRIKHINKQECKHDDYEIQ